ncbi:MAG: DNA polymerase I [Bacteroidia bacterium]|nr:DNA polymerase I [Bacteroidia bacterium]MCZ2278509.1 DNA polymerase I [Bacteroidia bacterium]
MNKKLFLLDAMALIYRAYFAFSNNKRINSKGQNTSAVFGFATTLLEVLKKEKPTHIAVVFDTAAPTARHEDYENYKANRQEIPEDLAWSIPYVERMCRAFNIPVIAIDGYEADDLIGTLAKQAEKKGFTTFMMTPDKDYGQLVDENTFIYKPPRAGGSAQVLGIKEILDRWQINRIDQLIDILGLMGDSVDNIPGIPGVGEKTAIALIKQFDSMEKLYENTSALKGKLKERVEHNKELAFQSKRLATIITDAPVEFDEDRLKLREPDEELLKQLFDELEFRRLTKQLFEQERDEELKQQRPVVQQTMFGSFHEEEIDRSNESSFQTIHTVKHSYRIAGSIAERKELIQELKTSKHFCFDTETTGLDANQAELVGMSFSIKPHEAWYVPVPENYEQARSLVSEFKSVFEDNSIKKTGQNIKYDMLVLKWYDTEVKGELFDTMIAHFLIMPEMSHGMDVLAETFLNYSPVPIELLIGKRGKGQLTMRDVEQDKIAEYAAEDADITLQLRNILEPELEKTTAKELFENVEMPLVTVLASMEAEGIKLDKETLKDLSVQLKADSDLLENEICEMAGMKFNVSSPRQVGDVLFAKLNVMAKPPKTKTGQYSTAEDVLSKIENNHPIIKKILDYRELVKLKNTYVDVLPEMVNPRTGRIHTSYNQVVAVTGRLSSDRPNLQNIPIRTDKGRQIRKAFIPRSRNYILLSADYSQIELRIIASLSGDQGMMDAFNKGEDIHAATAAKVYGIPLDEVTSSMRRNAKMVNFGIIYGISAFGLAERLNISRSEAKGIIDNYFTQYPGIKDYMDSSIESARKCGYVETILGRRRYLRDINSANQTVRGFAERNAINAPIQGSAADMIKIAMNTIYRKMEEIKMKSKMILQIHDELVFDVYKEELEELKPLIETGMKKALPLRVPVEVSIGTGNNWLEAH